MADAEFQIALAARCGKLRAMKAIQIRKFGGPEVLELADLPVPAPGSGEVLIRVAAAGVNFAETLMREDRYVASYDLPATPGSEIAGTIETVGPDVHDLKAGDRVGAILAAARRLTGGYAQYAVAPADVTVPLPDALGFNESAALLVQGLTALHLTREAPPKGETVLVTAGGGGVASLLIQLARRGGAREIIAAASSEAKREHALAMGADRALGYGEIGGLAPSLVYDSVGGEVLASCLDRLAFKGRIVIYGALNLSDFAFGTDDLRRLMFSNQSLRGFTFGSLLEPRSLKRDLALLFALAASGDLTVPVGGIFDLENAADAHRQLQERASVGKLVLRC